MLGPSRISRYAESHIGRLSHQNHPEFWDWRSPLSSHRLWGLWVHRGRTVEHQIYGPRKGWANLCPENKCSNHWSRFTYSNLDSAGLTWNGPLPWQTKETVTAPVSVSACHIGRPIWVKHGETRLECGSRWYPLSTSVQYKELQLSLLENESVFYKSDWFVLRKSRMHRV